MSDHPIQFVGDTASEAHDKMLGHGDASLHNILCRFPGAQLDSALAARYEIKTAGETAEEALKEIVAWWQLPFVPSGPVKRFNHGSRLRARDEDWDQIPQVVDALKTDTKSTKGHATLQSHRPGYARTHGHPSMCEVFFALRDVDGRFLLDVTATSRKLELRYWWNVNVHELAALQALVIEGLARGKNPIEAQPGDIATFAFRAGIAPKESTPQVAIHALDRAQLFRPHVVRELAACLTKKAQQGERYYGWESYMQELVPSVKMNQEGFPICIDGLAALTGHVTLLVGIPDGARLEPLAASLTELLEENTNMVNVVNDEKREPVSEREYASWRSRCEKLINRALSLVASLIGMPSLKNVAHA